MLGQREGGRERHDDESGADVPDVGLRAGRLLGVLLHPASVDPGGGLLRYGFGYLGGTCGDLNAEIGLQVCTKRHFEHAYRLLRTPNMGAYGWFFSKPAPAGGHLARRAAIDVEVLLDGPAIARELVETVGLSSSQLYPR